MRVVMLIFFISYDDPTIQDYYNALFILYHNHKIYVQGFTNILAAQLIFVLSISYKLSGQVMMHPKILKILRSEESLSESFLGDYDRPSVETDQPTNTNKPTIQQMDMRAD